MSERKPSPTAITVHKQSRVLELTYDDGATFSIPFELLRVYSPSAEVRGHGVGQEVLQTGKRDININGIAPVGNYAIQPIFSDGHETGLYSWDYLYSLGVNQEKLWQDYLQRLVAAGFAHETGRDAATVVATPASHGCGSQKH